MEAQEKTSDTLLHTSLMSGVMPAATAWTGTWDQFVELVRSSAALQLSETDTQKRRAPSFSPCEFVHGHRLLENVRQTWGVVLDLDQVTDVPAVKRALRAWTYVAWTTWNSTAARPRLRVVLPVRGGVSGQGMVDACVNELSAALRGAARVDGCSRDRAHLWFMPWYKKSASEAFSLWENAGTWFRPRRRASGKSGSNIIRVDFTGVPSTKPGKAGTGSRNVSLHAYLGQPAALRCATLRGLIEHALAFNASMPEPLPTREARDVARKRWKWMTTSAGGIRKRARAIGTRKSPHDDADESAVPVNVEEFSDAFGPSLGHIAPVAPLLGGFLYPGVTLISAKMKEGKSFLVCQMAMSLASGTEFLASGGFEGFFVRRSTKVVVFAGEDTRELIASRYWRNSANENLPAVASGAIRFVYPEQMEALYERGNEDDDVPGLLILERIIRSWYDLGYRVIFFDPLRIVEAMFKISPRQYTRTDEGLNAHAVDFLTIAHYQRLCSTMPGLCILMSLHHGKNKRDHNASDPGDMVAGTTGLGAGAGCTISILPLPPSMQQSHDDDDEDGDAPKRRELYIHGRQVRQVRMLIEQHPRTGLWKCLGRVDDTHTGGALTKYLEALHELGAADHWVTLDAVAKHCGQASRVTVSRVLAKGRQRGVAFRGYKLIASQGKGYRMFKSSAN